MKPKYQKAMHQFYMDYIGPAFIINDQRIAELGRGLNCSLRFELNDKYDLLVIADETLVTTFSMDLSDNHIGAIHFKRQLDIHEEYVLAVMLLVELATTKDTVVSEKEAGLLETFKEVMTGIKDHINA